VTADADVHVITSEIRQAVKGREVEIIKALGIPYRDGKSHINCPHWDHLDRDPSWRFDERTGRAICTCGSHSIFDVLMKVERIAFGVAKIRAAEILGRQDLIRVPSGSKLYQRHDAQSLLNPPSDNRDDQLPFIYLGCRLGIEPADVPRPQTPVVGIESLAYFDPPARPPARPKLIGSWPCAVFGTIAADGRSHAQRVYISSDGRGKADLGGPDGKPRDPKKSTKLANGQASTAGCAVIWGNPERAPHLVLFEGIETAAAGAYDLRAEIEANEVYVAAAITAGGMEAFLLYPATKLVTLGADRDEAKEGPGYRRGERAARTFGLHNRQKVTVRIALPGIPGESVDWLDILRRDGIGAVRTGVLAAIPFEPTQDEIAKRHRSRDLAYEINQIAVPDLDGLVKETATNPGAAFTPEALELLLQLKQNNRAEFETVRSKLKQAGCRVSALETALSPASGENERSPSQSDVLIEIAQEAELFHTPDYTGFADITIKGHRETWVVRGKGFRQWLARQYFVKVGGAPSSVTMQSAINVIEAKACWDGPERRVHIRVGSDDEGKVYIDLGDPSWQAVEIDDRGWRIVSEPPVRFRRSAGMRPLPVPARGGKIGELKKFLNLRSETDFVLVVAWLLAALRSCGPYPVLGLAGAQGTAKSTLTAILRLLIDPNTAPLRALPREDRDLFIAATNAHLLAFDNVSGLPAWISDTLCRIATGGGFAVRQLYTDGDEVLFDAARPIVLNGIEDIITRPDLADRSLLITLKAIEGKKRRAEKELLAAFEKVRSSILGALFDGASCGLQKLSDVELPELPRMADFALWGTACETAFWPKGTFWAAYSSNITSAVDTVIGADAVATAVRDLVAEQRGHDGKWEGTASRLLDALGEKVGKAQQMARDWPRSANALSGRLRRCTDGLRKLGITIVFDDREGHKGSRKITIVFAEPDEVGKRSSASSADKKPNGDTGVGSDERCSTHRQQDRSQPSPTGSSINGAPKESKGSSARSSASNQLKENGAEDADDADDEIPTQFGAAENRHSPLPWPAGNGTSRWRGKVV
jgi:phage/plasmid primase-like uncharacterized protein